MSAMKLRMTMALDRSAREEMQAAQVEEISRNAMLPPQKLSEIFSSADPSSEITEQLDTDEMGFLGKQKFKKKAKLL